MQSGFCNAYPGEAALANGEAFSKLVGCPDNSDPERQLKCLESLPVNVMVAGMAKVQWGLNVDGKILPEDPSVLVKQGKFASAPVIFGNCKDENSFFLCPQYPNGITDQQYYDSVLGIIKTFYPANAGNAATLADMIVKKYPSSNYADPLQALIDVADLLEWFCPMQADMEVIASADISANALTFQYVLELVPGWSNKCFNVGHSFDLPFVFPLLAQSYQPGYKFTEAEQKLSEFMATSWAWFARFSNPGDSWAPSGFPEGTWGYTVLNDKISSANGFRLEDCQWWWKVSGSN